MHLGEVAEEIQHRIIHIFGRDVEGRRAANGNSDKVNRDPFFRDYLQFYEVGLISHASKLSDIDLRFASSSMAMTVKA